MQYSSDSESNDDKRRYDKEVERFREEVAQYYAQMKNIELQSRNLLDGMLRLNTEVLKLHVRMGDAESKIGLKPEDNSDAVLKDIVRDLRRTQRGIRDSRRGLCPPALPQPDQETGLKAGVLDPGEI